MTFQNLVWHRRDLRLEDNPALATAWTLPEAIVLGIFIFDPAILYNKETGGGKVAFMLGCLQELRDNYRTLGSDLLFFKGEPAVVWQEIATIMRPDRVLFNEDVEPLAIARDQHVKQVLHSCGVAVQSFLDIGLHDPTETLTKPGAPYKIYTPYWRNWSSLPKPQPLPKPSRHMASTPLVVSLPTIDLPTLADLGFSNSQTIARWGEAEAIRLLQDFQHPQKLLQYKQNRDQPALEGTSRLSPHLRFGTIGIRAVWQATQEVEVDVRSQEEQVSLTTWRQELAWREFYQHVLFHFPELADRAFQKRMQQFVWDNREDYFQAWCAGRTGYPIVDAAMEQLNQTGWMHNRCRMIVANFLTKDLLINWQWGERYFMQQLVDGDQTANNGGWQWSASSGMDQRPLRIFNPLMQATKYDPEAQYIRQWLPQLDDLTTAELISGNIAPSKCHDRDYPLPIVVHQEQQQKFKERYQESASKH